MRLDGHVGRVGVGWGFQHKERRATCDRALDDLAEIARSGVVRLEVVDNALEALEHLGWLQRGPCRKTPQVFCPVFEEADRVVVRRGGSGLPCRLNRGAVLALMLHTLALWRTGGLGWRRGVPNRP